jgi:LuxR family maltose regulon positive regulatory protein
MAGSLLESKLYVPNPRGRLVPRPRLSEQIQRAAEAKLTLVSAPAGFGKTTLLAAWLAADSRRQRCVAWLSLDETDNTPAEFWTYVIAARIRRYHWPAFAPAVSSWRFAPRRCASHPTRPPPISTR